MKPFAAVHVMLGISAPGTAALNDWAMAVVEKVPAAVTGNTKLADPPPTGSVQNIGGAPGPLPESDADT